MEPPDLASASDSLIASISATDLPALADAHDAVERTLEFERTDASEILGERTLVMSGAYELRPRFTGRAGAIARLADVTEHAFAGAGVGFAVVVGEPGMGKSRLASELAARVRAAHGDALVMAGLAEERAPAYGPVARALAGHFGIGAGEPAAAARDKIWAAVGEVLPAARVPEVAHLIANMLRVPFDDSAIVGPLLDSPKRLEARLFMALRRFIAAEAERRPVLLLVENLERCGTDTIHLLCYLAAGHREDRLAIVGTATDALFERHASITEGDAPPVQIELGALSAGEGEALFRELCRGLLDVPAALVAHVRGLGGSPRAILELMRLLLESGAIVREGILWRVDAAALAAMALPGSYDEIVAARLRVMDDTERRVCEMAAVIGEVCWLDAILALERSGACADDPDGPTLAQIAASGDRSRVDVVAAIGKLVEREWLVDAAPSSVAGERELRFPYANLWEIVYRGVDGAARRTYHAAVARWLELHPEGRAATAQEEVARHLALAGDLRDAAGRYRRSADAARAAFQHDRAIRLLDRALACIGTQDSADLAARLHIWHDLGSIYELIGDFEGALGAFERMLRLSWVAASKTKAGVAFNKMGRVWRRRGDLRLALEYLERGLELFRSAGDPRGIASSLDDIGKALQLLGRYDDAYEKITEALARRGEGGDPRAIATSLSRLGDIQLVRGQYEAALACHREAQALRHTAGDRWGRIVSQHKLAELAFEIGEHAEARAGWLRALPDAEAIGAAPLSALVLTHLGELALADGKLEEARSRLDDALEIIDSIEDRGLESTCCRHLAALELRLGHPDAARELAERALEVASAAGLREREGFAFLTLGEVLAATRDVSAGGRHPATRAFTAATDIFQGIGHAAALARAQSAFGRFQLARGDLARGKDLIRDAIMAFTKLGLARPAAEAELLLSPPTSV